MPALAGARAFKRGGDFKAAAGFHHRPHVVLPAVLVEVHGEEMAAFVGEHRIDPGDEFLARLVLAREVPADHLVSHRQEGAVRAVAALDPRLLTDAADPLVAAGRGVAGAAGLLTFEAPGIEILAALEQRAEERDLVGGRAEGVDPGVAMSGRMRSLPTAHAACIAPRYRDVERRLKPCHGSDCPA